MFGNIRNKTTIICNSRSKSKRFITMFTKISLFMKSKNGFKANYIWNNNIRSNETMLFKFLSKMAPHLGQKSGI